MNHLLIVPSPASIKPIEQTGLAAYLMFSCKNYQLYQLACLRIWIEPAIRHQQIQFFFNEYYKVVGYVTWALLAPDVEHRLSHDPNVLFHESEWNEGESLWIMDFVAPFGHAREIIRHVRTELFPDHQQAQSLRRNADGSVRKVSLWRR